ncbi:MAG: hypothetical protein HC910_01715 [Spirulinaceae cyanobacterium SM2_1_0]|nr:hypothetical protein [Spirulinaceae cyanobacterium SM2_1_0]
MKRPLHILRSLSLTAFFSFATPIVLAGSALMLLAGIGLLPGLQAIAHSGTLSVLYFLATFGSGHPLTGSLVIGLTWSLVGVLFDFCTVYRYELP